MAKTKTIGRKDNPTTKSTDHQNPQDASKKLAILKSLNTMLLKETVERRQEVKCLLESKKVMETELARLSSDVVGIKSQFTRFMDENIGLYLENDLLSAFIESQVQGIADELDGLKVEIGDIKAEKGTVMERNEGLVREKAGIKKELEAMEREMMEVVREKNEMEMAKSEGNLEIGSLKRSVSQLEGEIKKEKEIVDRLTRERNGFHRDLDALMEETERLNNKLKEIKNRELKREGEIKDATGVIELLKEQIEEREREKALLNKEKYQQLTRICELEKEIGAVKAAGTTKKNFWTLAVSSVTTIVAVAIASFACANISRKGH